MNGIAVGAPVVVVEGSLLVHIPSPYRLGRGTLRTPISTYVQKGYLPLKWTTFCGKRGVVVINHGEMMLEAEVCPGCLTLRYHDDSHDD